MSRSIDYRRLIDEAPISALQWRVVGLCFIVAMLDGFDSLSIGFVAPLLIDDFGLPKNQMGYVFSSALAGILTGALIFSVVADNIGRRKVLIGSCIWIGLASLATSQAQSLEHLLIFRFLIGIGLGAAMPNLNSMTSDFAPTRMRSLMMTMMFTGFSGGGFLGAFLSNYLVQEVGWRAVFVFGGVAPLLMAIVLFFMLPESIGFLAARRPNAPASLSLLQRILPDYQMQDGDVLAARSVPSGRTTPKDLFRQGRSTTTLMFWGVFFCNLMVLYMVSSWAPTILREAGLTLEQAVYCASFAEAGGVLGGLCLARLQDKKGPTFYLSVALAIGATALVGLAFVDVVFGIMVSLAALFGFCTTGAQFSMNALAGAYYPSVVRATGIGYALAVGRIGAILGPILLGIVLEQQGGRSGAYLVVAVCSSLTCMLSILLIKRLKAI